MAEWKQLKRLVQKRSGHAQRGFLYNMLYKTKVLIRSVPTEYTGTLQSPFENKKNKCYFSSLEAAVSFPK